MSTTAVESGTGSGTTPTPPGNGASDRARAEQRLGWLLAGPAFVVMLLVATGLRERVMNAVPLGLRKGIAIGIGLFIMLIGLVDSGFVSRHSRSNGNRHAFGAISWWTALGPQVPGWYIFTGGGSSSSGVERSHSDSMPSAVVNRVWSPRIASRISRS